MRTITLEEHFVTKDFLRATGDSGYQDDPHMQRLLPRLLDMGDGRVEDMRSNGISMQVLSLAALGIEGLHAAEQTFVLHDANDQLAARVREHPEHLAGFAALGMKEPENAAAELERAVEKLGFVGAMVNGTVLQPDGPEFLDHPRYLPFWETAARLAVPIYLHPAPPPEPVQDIYYRNIAGPDSKAVGSMLAIAGWGWHIETGLHTLRLITSGLFDRLPTLQLIIGHMGEGLPYALARTAGILDRAATHLQRSVTETFLQQVHVTTSGYFTRPPFDCAEEVLGIDRLLFSVDYPFSPNEKGRAFLDALNPMNNDRRAKLTHGNAEALLKLPAAAA